MLDLRAVNGQWHLVLDGFRNHRQPWVLDLFREIARLAPSSYGLLHVRDDEAPGEENAWLRWEMVRGEVTIQVDESFSPHVPTLADD
jgi:hypothetical protein